MLVQKQGDLSHGQTASAWVEGDIERDLRELNSEF